MAGGLKFAQDHHCLKAAFINAAAYTLSGSYGTYLNVVNIYHMANREFKSLYYRAVSCTSAPGLMV